jgi:hypothetical protein
MCHTAVGQGGPEVKSGQTTGVAANLVRAGVFNTQIFVNLV